MRKFSSFLLALLIVLSSVQVASAKAISEAKVDIYNRTNADITLRIVDAEGQPRFFTLPAGWSAIVIPQGKYDFYANTNCGSIGGAWNIVESKKLEFNCDMAVGATAGFREKSCGKFGVYFTYTPPTVPHSGNPAAGNYFVPYSGLVKEIYPSIDIAIQALILLTNNQDGESSSSIYTGCYDGHTTEYDPIL